MPQNLGPQTNSIVGNQIETELNQKPKVQPKYFNRWTNSKLEGSRSSTEMHEATIHDPNQQIRTQTPQNQMNKLRMKNRQK
jgi:hypothetical protein